MFFLNSSPTAARRRLAVLVVAASTLLVLSACAPAQTQIRHTNSPHHAGSTPSSTPTAAALAPPKVRIPLSCDQVAPSSMLNSVMNTTMSTTPAAPAYDLDADAAIQDGALNCSWQGAVSGGTPGANYTLYAMPDATSIWQTYSAGDGLGSAFPSSYVGPNAYGYCNNDLTETPHFYSCGLDILIGSVWLDISGSSNAGTVPATPALVQSKFQPLLKAAVTALQGVSVAEPAWSDPAATPVSLPANYGVVDETAFETAIDNKFAIEVDQPDFSLAGAQVAEFIPVNYRVDIGGGTGAGDTVTPATNFGLSLEVLPSGSWAYAQIVQAESSAPGFTTLTGYGTKAVMFTAGENSLSTVATEIVGIVGEHLYAINVGDPGTPGTPNTVTMAKAAAAYVVKELG